MDDKRTAPGFERIDHEAVTFNDSFGILAWKFANAGERLGPISGRIETPSKVSYDKSVKRDFIRPR